MCGIAGSFGPEIPDRGRIERTLKLMRHRGPDANGWVTESIGNHRTCLLHTRLAIIDCNPRANQPFVQDDCVLVFNGEIYNFLELRADLEAEGHRFVTTSDTEVIIHAYHEWGDTFVDRFEGMWAFALLDKRKGRLILGRDPFGEKPLYYLHHNDVLYFGSEAKFLTELSGEPLESDLDTLRCFLVNGYKAVHKKPRNFLKGIKQFPAASIAAIERGVDVQPRPYWVLRYDPKPMSLGEAVEGAREHLVDAVRLRLRSDVPIAFCLSGGVDSGAITSIARKLFGQDLHAFSILDTDARYNEEKNITTVVDELECEHTTIHTKTGGFLPRLRKLISYHEAPVFTINYYLHSLMMEEIRRRGYKVALAGTGGDELFSGYYDHYAFWLAEMRDRPDFPRLVEDWRESYGAYVRNPVLQDPLVFAKRPDAREHIYLNNAKFASFLREPFAEPFSESPYSDNPLRNRMLNEMRHETLPVFLREEDLNAMYFSVENRSPLLDCRLATFLFGVSNAHLIHDGYTKYIMRAAVEGLVNDNVRLDKRKRGFNASLFSLIDRTDPETRDFLLDDGPIFDIVDREAIRGLLESDYLEDSLNKFLFSFISSKVFLETRNGSLS